MNKLSLLVILSFVSLLLSAQSPPREMRATWLTTVWRLDWPSVTVPSPTGTNETSRQSAINTQKAGLIAILDKLKEANMNATFLQVRPMADALYQSSYEPWSSFISAQRGDDPGWDPLAFAIEEAHKRGIELHAWINPYRYSSSSATHGNLPTDYANTHPEWLIDYGSSIKILNPGIPEVRQRITDIVKEIVTKYKDLDGIVFDDYFYANGKTTDAMDQPQYTLYNPDNLGRADWRRQNVNKMVKDVYNAIQAINPSIRFGISPAGVAATSQAVADKYGVPRCPVGSDWQYNGIYADPLAWLSEGTIDYISPQVYWPIGSSTDYQPITQWWSYVAPFFNRHVYISHSLTDMAAGAPAAQSSVILNNESIQAEALSDIERSALHRQQLSDEPQRIQQATNWTATEIGAQINVNRSSDINQAPGSVFYATNKTINTAGFITYLKSNVFTAPALTPHTGWKESTALPLVSGLLLNGNELSWNNAGDRLKYVIYSCLKTQGKAALHSPGSIQGISYTNRFILSSSLNSDTHYIGVSILDGLGQESAVALLNEATQPAATVEITYPVHQSATLLPAIFRWTAVEGAYAYQVQIAYDNQFTRLLSSREVAQAELNTSQLLTIKTNTQYHFRVRALKLNAPPVWSPATSFTSKIFSIVSPANQSTQQETTLTISWDSAGPGSAYVLEIATDALFSSSKIVYHKDLENVSSFTLPEGALIPSTTYFARVKVNNGAISATSATLQFTTRDLEIPVPVISSPANESTLVGDSIRICWAQQASRGFRVELSKDPSFPTRGTTLRNTDAFTYCYTYTNLTAGTYYLRVRAVRAEDLSEPSGAVKIMLTTPTGLEAAHTNPFTCVLTSNSLMVYAAQSEKVKIDIYSTTGILQESHEADLQQGVNLIPNLRLHEPSGIRIITITNNETFKHTYKLIYSQTN